MDFFEYFNSVSFALGMTKLTLSFRQFLWYSLGIAGGIWFLTYLFEGIGLYTAAKRRNLRLGWLAFVPFGNTYLMGALGGEGNFFSAKIKHVGLWAMLTELLCAAVSGTSLTAQILLQPYAVQLEDSISYVDVPDSLVWAAKSVDFLYYGGQILQIIYVIFLAIALMAFFRSYYARGAMVMAIAALFFPISKGFLIFAVRKNKYIDYAAFVRAQQEELRRRQAYGQNPYNPYWQNPYNQNPYNQNPSAPPRQNPTQAPPEDPFEEFSSAPSEPSGDSNDPNDPNDLFH